MKLVDISVVILELNMIFHYVVDEMVFDKLVFLL
jgi:hypothetical protein